MTAVGRGHEMIEVMKIPMRMAPFTRYSMRNTVRILDSDQKTFLLEFGRENVTDLGRTLP